MKGVELDLGQLYNAQRAFLKNKNYRMQRKTHFKSSEHLNSNFDATCARVCVTHLNVRLAMGGNSSVQ